MIALVTDSTNAAVDVARVLGVYTPAVLIAGMTIYVIGSYYRSYRFSRRICADRRGLLPLHVWTISLSYLLITFDAAFATYQRVGHGVTAHLLILTPTLWLGVFSIVKILSHERLQVLREKKTGEKLEDVLRSEYEED